MKFNIKHTLFALAILFSLSSSPLAAQDAIPIAAGSSSGTYKKFLDEITAVTGGSITFVEVESHGAEENLNLLVTNKVAMAFMHSDVPFFRSQREDLSRFKTLLALFTEEVHYLAPRVSLRPATRTGGTLGFGGTVTPPKELKTIEDLKGLKVGASGGSAITAQTINLQGNIGYEFVKLTNGTEVLAALAAGTIDAAVFVGGAPLPNLEKLGNTYKLLPIGTSASALMQVYKPATVTYPSMQTESITTVGADAILLSREYRSEKMVTMLKKFRTTFFEKLVDLQETPGIHAKWQEVKPDNKGKWPYLELGDTPAAQAAPLVK